MSSPLYPTWAMPQTQGQLQPLKGPPSYPTGVAFDFVKGDFVLGATGAPLVLNGEQAWAAWCVKAVLVQWRAFAIYDANYGCDLASVEGAASPTIASQNAQSAITRALLADPRTRGVDQFSATQDGDSVIITFRVTPVVGTSQRIVVQIGYS